VQQEHSIQVLYITLNYFGQHSFSFSFFVGGGGGGGGGGVLRLLEIKNGLTTLQKPLQQHHVRGKGCPTKTK
jgi:hypothetical protein